MNKHLLLSLATFGMLLFAGALPVSAASMDATPPVVKAITPASTTANTPTAFSATFTDGGTGVTQCALLENGDQLWVSDTWPDSFSGTSTVTEVLSPGTHELVMQCTDAAGNVGFSPKTSVKVVVLNDVMPTHPTTTTATTTATTVTSSATSTSTCAFPAGQLVKLPDDGNASTTEDSAVYYYANDCHRHAFPNAKVFFTWYQDFDHVQTVPATELAQMPLGANVTYRPGVRLVKFATDPKVYAVSRGGDLRWVASESVAASLYGSAWNTLVDDIPDAFHANYAYGQDISSAGDFHVDDEEAGAPTIDDSLR